MPRHACSCLVGRVRCASPSTAITTPGAYCQKVWLWLEEKRILSDPQVTMFCYGEKERWYKQVVPSGMLPALELDGRLYTESDVILQALEGFRSPSRPG